MEIDVSIIIVNYNTLKMTSECIDSIYEQTRGVSFEIILVDNASTDGSREFFSQDNRIKYIYNVDNLGFGLANNIGYEQSIGKYVFCLNSDTILSNNAIKIMYEYAEVSSDNIACIGGLLFDRKGQLSFSYGSFPSIYRLCVYIAGNYFSPLYKILYAQNFGIDFSPKIVDFVSGADLFIKRSIIERYGLYDHDFFMYYEDTELQYRYRVFGYYTCVMSTPHIVHLQGDGRVRRRSLKSLCLSIKGCFIYTKKTFSCFRYCMVRLLYLGLLPKIIIYPTNIQEKVSIVKILFGRVRAQKYY